MSRPERKRLFSAALAAFLVMLPCWWLLTELAYAAHPSYTHKFGSTVVALVNEIHYRGYWRYTLRLLQPITFIICFILLQELCLQRWPMTHQRLIPAGAVVLALTSIVVVAVLAMEDFGHIKPVRLVRVLYLLGMGVLWLVPWIAYGYLIRSFMIRFERVRWGIGLGAVLALALILMACSHFYGEMDGLGQAIFAAAATLVMIALIAGNFSDFICCRGVRLETTGPDQIARTSGDIPMTRPRKNRFCGRGKILACSVILIGIVLASAVAWTGWFLWSSWEPGRWARAFAAVEVGTPADQVESVFNAFSPRTASRGGNPPTWAPSNTTSVLYYNGPHNWHYNFFLDDRRKVTGKVKHWD